MAQRDGMGPTNREDPRQHRARPAAAGASGGMAGLPPLPSDTTGTPARPGGDGPVRESPSGLGPPADPDSGITRTAERPDPGHRGRSIGWHGRLWGLLALLAFFLAISIAWVL